MKKIVNRRDGLEGYSCFGSARVDVVYYVTTQENAKENFFFMVVK